MSKHFQLYPFFLSQTAGYLRHFRQLKDGSLSTDGWVQEAHLLARKPRGNLGLCCFRHRECWHPAATWLLLGFGTCSSVPSPASNSSQLVIFSIFPPFFITLDSCRCCPRWLTGSSTPCHYHPRGQKPGAMSALCTVTQPTLPMTKTIRRLGDHLGKAFIMA